MHNQNRQLKKMLDLRKAFFSESRPCLYKMFAHLHPDMDARWPSVLRRRYYSKEWWDYCNNREEEWTRKVIGCRPFDGYHRSTGERRVLNRKQRRYEKRSVNNAHLGGDWEGPMLTNHRHFMWD